MAGRILKLNTRPSPVFPSLQKRYTGVPKQEFFLSMEYSFRAASTVRHQIPQQPARMVTSRPSAAPQPDPQTDREVQQETRPRQNRLHQTTNGGHFHRDRQLHPAVARFPPGELRVRVRAMRAPVQQPPIRELEPVPEGRVGAERRRGRPLGGRALEGLRPALRVEPCATGRPSQRQAHKSL